MEPTITIEDLTNLVSSLQTEDAGRLALYQAMLDNSRQLLNYDVWGDRYKSGVLFLTAHNILSFDSEMNSGDRGPILSEKVGDLSRTYANPSSSASSDDLESTIWGRLFLQLRSTVVVGGPFVT